MDNIEIMKEKLLHEGWSSSDNLPEGWLFKKFRDGEKYDGEVRYRYQYIADDGKLFEGTKNAFSHQYLILSVPDCLSSAEYSFVTIPVRCCL